MPENFSAPGPYEKTGTNTAEWLPVLKLKSVLVYLPSGSIIERPPVSCSDDNQGVSVFFGIVEHHVDGVVEVDHFLDECGRVVGMTCEVDL